MIVDAVAFRFQIDVRGEQRPYNWEKLKASSRLYRQYLQHVVHLHL